MPPDNDAMHIPIPNETTSDQEPTLMGIAPELRSIIWELALRQPGPIWIEPVKVTLVGPPVLSLRLPPLLSAREAICKEAKGIFYRVNLFAMKLDLEDNKSGKLRERFGKLLARGSDVPPKNIAVRLTIAPTLRTSADNLVAFMQEFQGDWVPEKVTYQLPPLLKVVVMSFSQGTELQVPDLEENHAVARRAWFKTFGAVEKLARDLKKAGITDPVETKRRLVTWVFDRAPDEEEYKVAIRSCIRVMHDDEDFRCRSEELFGSPVDWTMWRVASGWQWA